MRKEIISPERFFGFQLGADRKIARWDQVVRYFYHLQENSQHILVQDLGSTTQGNPFFVVIISSSKNLAKLELLREMNHKLNDPKNLSEEEKNQLVLHGKAVICQSMGLHANEIGGTQMAPELAYELVTRTDDETNRILENVIFLMVPCLNPDGQIMVTDWFNQWLDTEYEGCELPWLYHPYAGHDNNRDSFQGNLIESRYMNKIMFVDWIPQAYVDHHHFGSYGARFYIPPYCEPIHPHADPLVWREHSWFGSHMACMLEVAGKEGVLNAAQFPAWGHLGFHRICMYHNIAGMLTESASVNLAKPIFIEKDKLTGDTRGWLRIYGEQLNFPHPWEGGWWRLRDIVEQIKISAWAALDLAARNKELLLTQAWMKAKRQVERNATGPVKAYMIPSAQLDALTFHKMVDKLLQQGVRVHYASHDFQLDGKTFSGGAYLIFLDQPKNGLVTTLLGQTFYPDNPWTRTADGTPIQPWDMTTDTMPEFMGVDVYPLSDPPTGDFEQISSPVWPSGGLKVIDDNGVYCISCSSNASFAAVNDLLMNGAEILRSSIEFAAGGSVFLPGSFVIKNISENLVEQVSAEHRIDVVKAKVETSGLSEVRPKRIGIYQRYWGGNADEGWTRFTLEEFHFAYVTVMDHVINNGLLPEEVDILVLPSDSAMFLRGDVDKLWEKKIANRPFVEFPPQYQSGITEKGVQALKDFVAAGGKLVVLGKSCDFAIETFELDVVNVVKNLDPQAFYCPGSTLKAAIDTSSPGGFGMKENAFLVFYDSAAFDIPEGMAVDGVVARYVDADLLQSGWLIGEEVLAGKAAILNIPYQKGELALIGCRVQNRSQTDGSYKLLFNQFF